MPSHLKKRRTNIFFPVVWRNYFLILSKFKPPGRTGMCQFKISPIPWLEHIPIAHLDEKSMQIHCKTKKNNPSESQQKKHFLAFLHISFISGLVKDFRQFKFPFILLFSLVFIILLWLFLNLLSLCVFCSYFCHNLLKK